MEVLEATGQRFETLQQGHTMLLFRADEYRTLELCRALSVEKISAKIQAVARANLTRRFLALLAAVRPRLGAATASRDLATIDEALAATTEALGVFAGFSVAVPVKEWGACLDMREGLVAAAHYGPILSDATHADLNVR